MLYRVYVTDAARAIIDAMSGSPQNNPRYREMIDRRPSIQEDERTVIDRIRGKLSED